MSDADELRLSGDTTVTVAKLAEMLATSHNAREDADEKAATLEKLLADAMDCIQNGVQAVAKLAADKAVLSSRMSAMSLAADLAIAHGDDLRGQLNDARAKLSDAEGQIAGYENNAALDRAEIARLARKLRRHGVKAAA